MIIFIGLGVVAVGIVLWNWHRHRKPKPPPPLPPVPTGRISLLVPFRASDPQRARLWDWLRAYWEDELPDAEIVTGTDHGHPFSKAAAVNDAASRATGDIFVILDADAYLYGWVISIAAARIRAARAVGHRLWFIPYRHLFRLTQDATEMVLASDPADPLRFTSPPPRSVVEDTNASGHGHWYAALCQILPREAFEAVGGMDPRFRGWGGEDVSFMHAVDTLWHRHKTTRNDILHLWHPKISGRWKFTRQWPGQESPGANDRLAGRYNSALGDREAMERLVREVREENQA